MSNVNERRLRPLKLSAYNYGIEKTVVFLLGDEHPSGLALFMKEYEKSCEGTSAQKDI